MKRGSLAGLGALAFVVLSIVAMAIDNGPGGNYKRSDVEKYLRHSHHLAIWVASYLIIVGVLGLVVFLARLRDSIGDEGRARTFWALSVTGATAIVVGWALHASVPIAMAYGGKGVSVAPTVTFAFTEGGWAVLSAGAVVIGLALLIFVLGGATVPAWVRWFTLVGVAGAVSAPAFFPFLLFFIWAAVVGIWLVATPARSQAPAPVAA